MVISEKKCIVIHRRNAVSECIKSGKAIKVFADPRHENDSLVNLARAKNIAISVVPPEKLSSLCGHQPHQGLICLCPPFQTISLNDLIAIADKDEHPLILMLDGIEDPHNLGAILRSCDAFSIGGVIIKKVGNAPLNSTVANISTGAIHYVPVCEVSNLNQAITSLKQAGYWVASSDGEADLSYQQIDYQRKLVLVVGSEGFGISKLVLRNSDYIVKIPMKGHVNSLNASVATGILLAFVRANQWDK